MRTSLSFASLAGLALPLGLALALGFAAPAHAQMNDGVIIGDVVDGDTGEDVAGVTVTATSPAMQGKQSAVTDGRGRFRLDGLPIGSYALAFTKEGFSAEPIGDIKLRAGATLRYDAVIYKSSSSLSAGAGDTVRVVATAPVVDVGSTQSGGTLNSDVTRRVPLVAPGGRGGAQRSFEAAAHAMPQVQDDVYGAGVNGATSVENQYVIDGISVNNTGYGYLGSPLSLEFIDEVSVITGGYMPEYGRSMGGLLNVVTKSGGNETHGSVFANGSPGFLEGERQLAANNGSAIRVQPSLNYVGDVGFELGGPILPDSLWYYVGADLNQQSFKVTRRLFKSDGTEIQGTRKDFFAEGTGLQAIAKLTWLANEDNRLSFTLLATPTVSGGNGKLSIDPLTGRPEQGIGENQFEGSFPALAHIRRSGAVDAEVKWTSSLLNKKLKLDTSIGYHNELGGETPSDGSAIGSGKGLAAIPRVFFRRSNPGPHSITDFEVVPDSAGCDPAGTDNATECPVTSYQFGGNGIMEEQQFNLVQLRHVTTYLADFLGLHVLKAGAEVGYGAYDELKAYGGGLLFKESTSGSSYSDNRGFGFLTGPDTDPNNVVHLDSLHAVTHDFFVAGFLQDSWSLNDLLTVNLGLRYDGEWLQGGDNVTALAMPNELSPRAGVIVDPLQSGKLKIFGSYARYYETIPLDIADRQGTPEPSPIAVHDASACDPRDPKQLNGADSACRTDANRFVINDPSAPNQKYLIVGAGRTPIDPDIQPSASDEIMLGAEAEVFKDARVSATYTRRWIGCPWNGAESVGGGALCTRTIEDMSRDEANTYFIGNPGFGIASDFPIAQRNYDALTLQFYKQWGDEWLAEASYTLSSLTGNYAGLFRPETEQLDPNINSDFDLKSLVVNRNGPLPFDHTHTVKFFGAREFQTAYDTHFTVGAAGSAQSGAPSNLLGSHPVYGGKEVFILPRGSGDRLPPSFSLDGKVGFTFSPFKGQAVELTLDVFNIFNFQSPILLDEEFTAADVNPLINCQKGVQDSCTRKDLSKLKNADNTSFDPVDKNPNFGQPLQFQAPRTVSLGARWSF